MTIYIHNPGLIDLEAITVMGVSAKETENPIGYFGTGAKYAIAILLRTGHEVRLRQGSRIIHFTAHPLKVRGTSFHRVFMDEEPLGFTTDLGKNWEVWQAYRELVSNALDEGGGVTPSPQPNAETEWQIGGSEFEKVFAKHGEIFLQSKPLETAEGVEIHPMHGRTIFYRGIRVAEALEPTAFTYNIIRKMDLTEDRTLKFGVTQAKWRIEEALPACSNAQIVDALLRARHGSFEFELNFADARNPSPELLEALRGETQNLNIAPGLRKLLACVDPGSSLTEFTPSGYELSLVEEAIALLAPFSVSLTPAEIHFVETLGKNNLAAVLGGRIYLTRQVLNNGVNFIASTILEEWLHLKHDLDDCSRAMQQWLFDALIAKTAELAHLKEKLNET